LSKAMQSERACHEHPNIDCSRSVGSPDFTLGRAVFSRIYRKCDKNFKRYGNSGR